MELNVDITITLDKSKKFSTIHGERMPDDPQYKVHYCQDDLPFDSQGNLIPDDWGDNMKEVYIEGEDGSKRRVIYKPLYNKAMRDKVAKKLARLKKGQAKLDEKDEVQIMEEDESRDQASEDVNLEAYLKGKMVYPAFMIFAAYQKRFHKKTHRLRDVVADLVYDERIIPEAEVHPRILSMIDQAA